MKFVSIQPILCHNLFCKKEMIQRENDIILKYMYETNLRNQIFLINQLILIPIIYQLIVINYYLKIFN